MRIGHQLAGHPTIVGHSKRSGHALSLAEGAVRCAVRSARNHVAKLCFRRPSGPGTESVDTHILALLGAELSHGLMLYNFNETYSILDLSPLPAFVHDNSAGWLEESGATSTPLRQSLVDAHPRQSHRKCF